MNAAEDPVRRCPTCSGAVSDVTVVGPESAYVDPCGHRISPSSLDDSGEEHTPTQPAGTIFAP